MTDHPTSLQRGAVSHLAWHAVLFALLSVLCSALWSCQLIGPLERELSVDEAEPAEDSPHAPTCQLTLTEGAQWWEGSWSADDDSLKLELMKRLNSNPQGAERAQQLTTLYAQSVAEAFGLMVSAQHASVRRDGAWRHFPISPLPHGTGVKLTSIEAHQSSTLWCQGERVFWSAEGGAPLPLKRLSSPSSVSPSPR
jgi:hypothetical protein